MVKFLLVCGFLVGAFFLIRHLINVLKERKHREEQLKLIDEGKKLYSRETKRSYDAMLDPYPDLTYNINDDYYFIDLYRYNRDITKKNIRYKWMFPQLYYDFLTQEYDMTTDKYLKDCVKRVSSYNVCLFDYHFNDNRLKNFINDIKQDILPKLQDFLGRRLDAIDPQQAYLFSIDQYTPSSDIEELELKIYITHNEEGVKQGEKSLYANDDMNRIKQLMDSIPPKIENLDAFNNQLQKVIEEYEQKAVKSIDVSYGSVLQNTNINSSMYYKSFNTISAKYSSKITPAVAMACDAAVKKVSDLIKQKKEIISRNNADIDKYNQVIHKLQQQYDDEFALQKIKELNRDVNSQMNNTDDIAHKEENNIKINNILDDIAQLDNEVNERRNIEISQGLIEI